MLDTFYYSWNWKKRVGWEINRADVEKLGVRGRLMGVLMNMKQREAWRDLKLSSNFSISF